MPTSRFNKTTKYFTESQINGFIKKHYKTNLSFDGNMEKFGAGCASALVQPATPFGALSTDAIWVYQI